MAVRRVLLTGKLSHPVKHDLLERHHVLCEGVNPLVRIEGLASSGQQAHRTLLIGPRPTAPDKGHARLVVSSSRD